MSESSHGGVRHAIGCAACKFQRKKCGPDCPLAPFFPRSSFETFLNAHNLFGIKRILEILRNLSPDKKITAAKNLSFEANARAADPVGGSYRIIWQLQRQIEDYQAELDNVMHQLTIYRAVAFSRSLNPGGFNSQGYLAEQFSFQDDNQALEENYRGRVFGGSSLDFNIQPQSENLNSTMRLVQRPPASISKGSEQHRGGMVSIPEGQDRKPEIKQEK